MVLVAPLVIACSIGLLASVYKLVNDQRGNRAIKRMNNMKVVNSNSTSNPVFFQPENSEVERNISISINGVHCIFGIPSEKDNISMKLHAMGVTFCEEFGVDMGFNMKSFGSCVNPIVRELSNYLDLYPSDTEIETKGDSLNDNDEESNDMESIGDDDLSSSFNAGEDGSRHEIALEVNGITYVFEYINSMEPMDASIKLAEFFCVDKGPSLLAAHFEANEINDEAEREKMIMEGCNQPIIDALYDRIVNL